MWSVLFDVIIQDDEGFSSRKSLTKAFDSPNIWQLTVAVISGSSLQSMYVLQYTSQVTNANPLKSEKSVADNCELPCSLSCNICALSTERQ